MRFDAGQHMRMEQRMRLSPRMIQSMEILQLSTLALEQRLDQEMEQNPVLEMELDQAEPSTVESGPADDLGEAPERERPEGAAEFTRAQEMFEDYGSQWAQNTQESAEYRPRTRSADGDRDAKMDAMANTAGRSEGLTDQLLAQWRMLDMGAEVRIAGEFLIGRIEETGYLRESVEELAGQAPPDVNAELLGEALELVRLRLEPVGIGAADLRQCMELQLKARVAENPDDADLRIALGIVRDHLPDVELNRLPRISRRSGWTLEQINRGLATLRRLDPYPGRSLAPATTEVIVPDVIVEYDPYHDRYVAAQARGLTPALRINPIYRKLAKDHDQEKTTRQYLAQNISHARWLIDAIQQRQTTLLRVVNVVLEAQRDFLDHGPQHLRPLPMIGVADELGIHVGTVSRAVADKYMQTPRGIYPLRMFFSGGTESAEGQEMSWAAVQAKLKEVIESESPRAPWSDDDLVTQLKTKGVEIARRTIAKYRQQMNIPPARRRRKY